MRASIATIAVPNVLGQGTAEIERFYRRVVEAPSADQYQFNMQAVTWIEPYGAVAIVLAARYLLRQSSHAIQIQNLKEQIHLYLRRMDILDNQYSWLSCTDPLSEDWFRNPQTPNLLELTPITGPRDVETVITRAELVFGRWLTKEDLYHLLTVLGEVCANIYQHSGDRHGCVLIQTYKNLSQGVRRVCLAVGDLGCGIQGSLVSRHGEIGTEPLDYLGEAIHGRTSRATGRGGLGLRRVRQITSDYGGYLWLRSDTASIFSQAAHPLDATRDLVAVPGTQLAVELQTPLAI